MTSKLTAKQRRFVQEYFVDYNATQAAIRAGYSAKTAEVIGYENLRKPQIDAEIQDRRATLSAKLEITQERVLQELATVGFSNATDFVMVETVQEERLGFDPATGVLVTLPTVVCQRIRITNTTDLPAAKQAAIAGIKQTANGIDIKLHDKVRALELLGRHLGLFDTPPPTTQENNLFALIVDAATADLQMSSISEIEVPTQL